MHIVESVLDGVVLLEGRRFGDERGWFSETYNAETLAELGITEQFVQDNQSFNASQGTVRGLHLQAEPHAQGKLVRVLTGVVFDVAVDVREGSATFGQWFGAELAADNHRQLWVPAGFAHGFMTLSDDVNLAYKVTSGYAPNAERSIRWDDPEIGIDWPSPDGDIVLSDKDSDAPSFSAYRNEVIG